MPSHGSCCYCLFVRLPFIVLFTKGKSLNNHTQRYDVTEFLFSDNVSYNICSIRLPVNVSPYHSMNESDTIVNYR